MSKNNRRQFLKNTSLAAIGLGTLSTACEVKAENTTNDKTLLTCDKTTLDYYGEGPFYTDSPPMIQDHQLAAADEPGTRMIISGRVYNLDCSEFIPETVVDVWHANDAGQYDNDSYNLRGFTRSNAQGFYMFETVMPGKYASRPAHIHFKIKPPGFELLTTQLYFAGDTSIPNDAAASITSGTYDATNRIIPLTTNADGKLEGTWDIVVNGEGIMTGTSDIHLDKGIVYSVSPNPFLDKGIIKYGVFKKSKVSLLVYDMQGREVANLEEKILPAEKYEAVWTPEDSLPNGHYFVALKINDLQVHYLKVVRQR